MEISNELKVEYLNQTADEIVKNLNVRGYSVYKKTELVVDLMPLSLSDTPDGGGDMYSYRKVLHIMKKIGEKPRFFGLYKKDIEKSLVMLENNKSGWRVHVLDEISDLIDPSISNPMNGFSEKIGEKYSLVLELSITYKR